MLLAHLVLNFFGQFVKVSLKKLRKNGQKIMKKLKNSNSGIAS